ncbi:protein FAR-RED IMPAIRED RESPONSE 1-like [Chenopodium quinoa]|uniref:protein FAR-RED IMPAIRED RESPONSE 1-like n=1 Tax=Chenopodium quinoa TaxID=63459 RepID=UPI000B781853|nr:protein FAR-RED IMPAIRED RESPONSE 1-like [Chenopodium quinoa]
MRARREAKKRAKAMSHGGTGGLVDGVVCEDELSGMKRTSKKCECQARVYAKVNEDGLWELKSVELKHNHAIDPANSKLVKEYRMRQMTSKVKKTLTDLYEQGVPISQIHGFMAIERKGNMALTVKDLQHEVYKARRLKMIGRDSVAMMEYFDKMQTGNQIFFHAQRLDEEGRLKDVLWVDARSRVAYEDFGDAVCFDATYLTNEYELPFANFVGVNHHGQSLLLGCALVSHEDCNTFAWIFRQWLACMNNRAPKAILTDQVAAMRRPLAEVMLNTVHRWCIWHIMSKIPEKLVTKSSSTPSKSWYMRALTPRRSKPDGQSLLPSISWRTMNGYRAYTKSHMWVLAYVKEFFWAGVKTTQRVESINRFFDGYVNRKTKLHEFPQKYCMALDQRVRDELSADARCSKYLRRLVSGLKVEKIFQKLYTDNKFQEVQKECTRMMYCNVRGEKVLSEKLIQYSVVNRVWIVPPGASEDVITNRRRSYNVTFCPVTKEVQCDCRKFETSGILCIHCIRILDENLVEDLLEMYVVDRWRKDIPRKHTRVKVAYHDPGDTVNVKRFNKMMQKLEPLCETAAMVDDQTVHMVIETLSKLQLAVNERRDKKSKENVPVVSTLTSATEGRTFSSVSNPVADATAVDSCPAAMDLVIKDPIIKKRKRGRPKGSRHKTLAETGYKKTNKNKKPSPEHAGNGVEEDAGNGGEEEDATTNGVEEEDMVLQDLVFRRRMQEKAGMAEPGKTKGKTTDAGNGDSGEEDAAANGVEEDAAANGVGQDAGVEEEEMVLQNPVFRKRMQEKAGMAEPGMSKGKTTKGKGKVNTSSRKLPVSFNTNFMSFYLSDYLYDIEHIAPVTGEVETS